MMSDAHRDEAERRAKELRALIERSDELYYLHDTQEIEDHEYDALMRELSDIETRYPELSHPDSPTARVSGGARSDFKKVIHAEPMQSLENALDKSELRAFFERVDRSLPDKGHSWLCEPKIDGLAVSLIYKDGVFDTGSTRGDGAVGEDITQNIRAIRSLPLSLKNAYTGIVELRGEVCMAREDFAKLNERREEIGEPLFANPRNAASGSLRQHDPRVTASRRLKIFLYSIRDPESLGISTQEEILKWIESEGLPIHGHSRLCRTQEDVAEYLKMWDTERIVSSINTDGVVVKLNELSLRAALGSTAKAPKWAIAFKYPPEEKRARVLDIDITVGRTGALTPTAVLEPISLSGTVVRRASLHNQDNIDRKDIRIGDMVWVRKAGEIIPEVLRVDTDARDGSEVPYEIPMVCPVCGAAAVRYPGESAVRCPNNSCPAQFKEELLHFVSRQCMDIDGIGEKLAAKLIDTGIVTNVADLYTLRIDDIAGIERLAVKSATNIIEAIERSKARPLSAVINALGIRNIGKKTAADIAAHFECLDDIASADETSLSSLDGIGPTAAASIKSFFGEPRNAETVRRLKEAGVNMRSETTSDPTKWIDPNFAGKKFVFTGELSSFTRQEAEAAAEARGASTSSSVSKKTDVVVAGESAGSKYAKALQLGITIWSEAEFIEKLK